LHGKVPDGEPGALPAVRHAVVWPSRAIVALLAFAFALGLRVPGWAEYLPFAASLVLFGLPHGAVDHLVPSRLAGRDAEVRGVMAVVVLYLALSGICLVLWFAAPAAAFVLFVAVTAFHWGAGDLHALLFFGDGGLDRMGGVSRGLLVLLRGGLPVLVPLVFFPEVYRGVAAAAAGLFDADASSLSWAFSPASRLAAGVALAVLAGLFFGHAAGDFAGNRRALLPVALETLLLFALFAVVPPVLAVGLYFALWHAPRHVARLILLHPAGARHLRDGRYWRALVRFARDAAPLTGLALALLGGLYLAVPRPAGEPGSLLALYLVLISALTLPHAALVAYMDARQGVWERAPSPPAGERVRGRRCGAPSRFTS
jgi:Brp/Blh family beta-carotene 15,15'-monooxygenase